MKKLGKLSSDNFVRIVLTISFVFLAINANTEYNKKADISSQRDLIQIEYNMSQTELTIARDEINELQSDNDELVNELVVLGEQIEDMKNEVDRVEGELEIYKYRELWYRNINLSEELQEYIYNMCLRLDLDYDIALAKMKLESQFNINAIGYNKDSEGNIKSTDHGIGQVNSNNLEWVNELCNRDVDVINNVYDNIEASLRIYKHYRDYWSNKGYNGLELEIRALNTYNMGVSGFNNYISNGNDYDDWRYAKLVMNNLNEIR